MKLSFFPLPVSFLSLLLLSSCEDERKGQEVGLNDVEQPNQEGRAGGNVPEDASPAPVDREMKAAQERASAGLPEDQYKLALLYADRVKKGKEDISKVIEWCEKSAAQGYKDAEMTLGGLYFYGADVKKDMAKAKQWFEAASSNASVEAHYYLGLIAMSGELGAKDLKKGWEEIKVAADKGLPIAMGILGRAYVEGAEGFSQQLDKGIDYLKKAAEAGDRQSSVFLGKMYYKGLTGDKNAKEAFRWYERAARAGDAHAEYVVALMYLEGDGVEKNPEKAVEWLKMSAGQNHINAMAMLSVCYASGTGVPADQELSRVWKERALSLQKEREKTTR